MKANNALILLWNGDTIPDYLIKKVAEVLTSNGICIPEMLTIKYKDEDAIAQALMRDSGNISVITNKSENDAAEAIKQAVIYIGKRFEVALKGTNGPVTNIAVFAIELSNAVAVARRNTSFIGVGTSNELLTAIEILSTTNAIIPSTLAKKYNFNQNVVDVIKKVYHSY